MFMSAAAVVLPMFHPPIDSPKRQANRCATSQQRVTKLHVPTITSTVILLHINVEENRLLRLREAPELQMLRYIAMLDVHGLVHQLSRQVEAVPAGLGITKQHNARQIYTKKAKIRRFWPKLTHNDRNQKSQKITKLSILTKHHQSPPEHVTKIIHTLTALYTPSKASYIHSAEFSKKRS